MFTGKTEESYLKEGIEIYTKRIKHYIPLEIRIIGELIKKSKLSSSKANKRESQKLISALDSSSYLVLMDEKGETFSSEGFAKFIEKLTVHGYKEIVFVTGGAFGFPDEFYSKANKIVSLSGMTFTHQMTRLILVEQIYRAMTIIRGEPYHHE